MKYLPIIALGSGLGGACRYLADLLALQAGAATFPAGTLAANVTGSLLIGWLAGHWAVEGASSPHPGKWHFWMTGVCAGYTTFSTFAWEVLEMVRRGEGLAGGLYAAASLGLGVLAVWLGVLLAMRRRCRT